MEQQLRKLPDRDVPCPIGANFPLLSLLPDVNLRGGNGQIGGRAALALDDVERQSTERGFLVVGLHILTGAVHRLDDLIE